MSQLPLLPVKTVVRPVLLVLRQPEQVLIPVLPVQSEVQAARVHYLMPVELPAVIPPSSPVLLIPMRSV
jgi:hypothetical protein